MRPWKGETTTTNDDDDDDDGRRGESQREGGRGNEWVWSFDGVSGVVSSGYVRIPLNFGSKLLENFCKFRRV